jgi:outer membrane protein assembly factor BamB
MTPLVSPFCSIMKKTLVFAFALLFLSVTAFAQEAEQWSRFHGPNGQGIIAATDLPTKWSADENIAWKTPIPGEGWSSPVIWNDHIFLTSTTDGGKECRVIAIDRKTGKILWNEMVFTQVPTQKHGRNSFATPTPVTDGQRVYAVFSGGTFIALNFEGKEVWKNTDLDFYSHHGFGASPIIYGDLLITPINPSSRERPNEPGWLQAWDQSYLLALDKNSGKEMWKGKRGMSRISHSVPVIIRVDGKDQILSAAGDVVQAFEPATGERIWSVTSSGEPAVPTPAIGEGMVYMATTGGNPIIGVKTDGKGDCTATHIVWQQRRNAPGVASFLYVKPCLYAGTENGTFSAFDAATGNPLWQQRLEGRIDSSPIYADGKIYVTSHIGKTMVLKPNADPTKSPEVVAENEINATVQATLAVAGKQIFIRTEKELWCIGK